MSLVLLLLAAVATVGSAFRMGSDETNLPQTDRPDRPAFEDSVEPRPKDRSGDSPTGGTDQSSVEWIQSKATRVPVGSLTVPAIGLRAPFRLGVHDAIVELGPGLWPGTPYPGEAGNAVFAGHRTTHTHPFLDLDLLEIGDVVKTRVLGRQGSATFKVSNVVVVPEERYADFVLRQPRQPSTRMLTLFACTPKGSRTHRIVVQAKVIDKEVS